MIHILPASIGLILVIIITSAQMAALPRPIQRRHPASLAGSSPPSILRRV